MAFPRRPSTVLRYLVPALILILTLYVLTEPYKHELSSRLGPLVASGTWWRKGGSTEHPIDRLIKGAEREFAAKLAKETQTLPDAAAAYRKRRGRHPPPGFDKWHKFAREKNAIIVEDFWDQIYHDLEPFWALDSAKIRRDAHEFEMRIEIRGHKASTGSDWFWTQIWLAMIQTIEHLLPDMDLALNAMDEPRTVVPWEEINGYMKSAAKTKQMVAVDHVVSEYVKLPPVGEIRREQGKTLPRVWEHESKLTCHDFSM